MRIALIGPTGFVGSAILKEALDRGHEVVAVTRRPETLEPRPGLTPAKVDVFDTAALAQAIRGCDAVIHAYAPQRSHPDRQGEQKRGTRSIIDAAKAAHIRRILAVGGAGTLEARPGVRNMDTPEFPKEWMMGAISTAEVYYALKQEPELEWTSLCPPHNLKPGERSGKYRLGKDALVRDGAGVSHVTVADYAVAMIDELENPRHIRQRFTIGY